MPVRLLAHTWKGNALHVNQTYALSANVVVVPCTRENVKSYRRFNQLMLPIPYGDAFYTDTVHDPVISDLTRLAYWDNSGKQNTSGVHVLTSEDGEARVGHNAPPRLVSAIRCQLLQHSSYVTHDTGKVLYISAISTLSPFRQHGFATHLLDLVKRAAIQQYGVVAIIAHVWEANSDAMSWYERRGFKSVSIDEQYYRRLAPRTAAYVVRRELGPSDLLHGVAA